VPSVERSPNRGPKQTPPTAPTAVMRAAINRDPYKQTPSKPFNLSGSYRSPIRTKKASVVQDQKRDDSPEYSNQYNGYDYPKKSRPNGRYHEQAAEEYDDDPMELIPLNARNSTRTQVSPRVTERSYDRNPGSKPSHGGSGYDLEDLYDEKDPGSKGAGHRPRFHSEDTSPQRIIPSGTNHQPRSTSYEDEAPLEPFMDESDGAADQYQQRPAKLQSRYRYDSVESQRHAKRKPSPLESPRPAKRKPSPLEHRDPNTKSSRESRERSISQFGEPVPVKRGRGRPPKVKGTGPPPIKKPRTLLSTNHESGKASRELLQLSRSL
jgi:hypothetical protein